MQFRFVIAAAFAFALTGPTHAADPVQQHNSNAIWFENWIGLSNGSLRVASPEGEMFDVFAEDGTPVFELSGSDFVDGVYRYELRAATDELVKNRNKSMVGRDSQEPREYVNKPFYRTGYFVVERGVIITPEETEEGDE